MSGLQTTKLELLSPTEMGEADRRTIDLGTPGIGLMERAGAAIAEAVRRRWSRGSIVVLAGPGNNGGDGWVAARLLRDAGHRVTVAFFGDRPRLAGDAATAAGRFQGEVVAAEPGALNHAGLIVDALFGAGIRLPLPPEALGLVEAVNRSNATVIAVDLPSGVSGATGEVGAAAVRADETVTFFRAKPGHVLLPGRGHCGPVTIADIGIPDEVLGEMAPRIWLNRPALWHDAMPRPTAAGHKYSRGHTLVVSGPVARTGAARLAAAAALRAGSGLVTVASPPDALAENGAQLTAVMLREMTGPEALARILADRRLNTVVLGPGLGTGETTRELVETALDGDRSVVLDADALTSFAEDSRRLLSAIAACKGSVVATPHEGEFARVTPDIVGSKLDRARIAAKRSDAVMVLKGADTVVAAPDGRAAIADNAPPALATAGAGDVLAGLIGGLLAQGMPAFEAAAAAVWLHGEAANELGAGLIAEDLAPAIPAVLQGLRR